MLRRGRGGQNHYRVVNMSSESEDADPVGQEQLSGDEQESKIPFETLYSD